MRLPRKRKIFENLPVNYIDLNSILNAGKTNRADKFHSYIQLVYPEEIQFIFLIEGEFYTAVKYSNHFSPITYEYMEKRKKSSERGFCSFYEIDFDLAKLLTTALPAEPDRTFDLEEDAFTFDDNTGIMLVNYNIEHGIYYIKKGHLEYGYLQQKKVQGEIKTQEMFTSDTIHSINYYIREPLMQRIVTPHMRKLMTGLMANLIHGYTEKTGIVKVESYLSSSKEVAEKKYTFLHNVILNRTNIIDNALADEETYIKGYAEWVKRFIAHFYKILTPEDNNKILAKAIHDYRYVLEKIKFISYIKNNE
ncbi:hypothetical protein J7J58_00910 [candidate division WOR-3 bacterium]|nr:hypothetical protein [candidate division WOR-3 bacterium]